MGEGSVQRAWGPAPAPVVGNFGDDAQDGEFQEGRAYDCGEVYLVAYTADSEFSQERKNTDESRYVWITDVRQWPFVDGGPQRKRPEGKGIPQNGEKRIERSPSERGCDCRTVVGDVDFESNDVRQTTGGVCKHKVVKFENSGVLFENNWMIPEQGPDCDRS